MSTKPLLLIDVDGPLNPWAAKPHRHPEGFGTHRTRPTGWEQPWQKPLRVWLNPDHGPALLALPFDLVWCTTWSHEANEWIGPHLGLPALPVVEWPEDQRESGSPYWKSEPKVFWKTDPVVKYAAGRPFAWVDDDITDLDRAFVAEHHTGQALLHHVDPRKGLLDEDFQMLAAWAKGLIA